MKNATKVMDTSKEEVNGKVEKASTAFATYRNMPAGKKAGFLRSVGKRIDEQRAELAALGAKETSLPVDRLQGEITRTVNQCYLFADLLLERSWVRAIIDTALPDRQPIPRPDLRQMQKPLGPVAVFGASNFPFAYSVCGGDTVSALAAGCPVVYKANPGHPETSEAVTATIQEIADQHEMPAGVFDTVYGASFEPGIQLVTHPLIKAVGFTGSLRGGRALFDAATKREEPIPVYAEMGSTNPVFILPRILQQKGADIARALAASNTASVGQFCTNPGIMVMNESEELEKFKQQYASQIKGTAPAGMLHEGIFASFEKGVKALSSKKNVSLLATSETTEPGKAAAYVFETSAKAFLDDHELWQETFGPSAIQVTANGNTDILEVARSIEGQLTVTVWGTDEDLAEHTELLGILEQKAGRIIINGVPTGVEVSPAMNHGGPYPATSDSKFTSVGPTAIYRFTRPVCYQNFPQRLLPEELRDGNPLGIWRMVNGKMTNTA